MLTPRPFADALHKPIIGDAESLVTLSEFQRISSEHYEEESFETILHSGGTVQDQEKFFRELFQALPLAVALIFGVLLAEFRNLSAPVANLASSILFDRQPGLCPTHNQRHLQRCVLT